MKELFQRILNEYLEAYNSHLANHPLANLIRKSLPEQIEAGLIDKERYKVKGSSGAGNWTPTPWVAIFDILITETAQSGYYPVFLFTDDMSGFYLSLNQGVTEIKEKYKKEASQVLKLKAEDFRSQLEKIPDSFNDEIIILGRNPSSRSHLTKFYEAGNIISKFYSVKSLPDDGQFRHDIQEILKVYEILSYNEGLPTVPAEKEDDEKDYSGFEELKNFRFHKRIERNQKLAKKVKEIQGYVCKACGFNFEAMYGNIGLNFIEAHHLIPLSRLKEERIKLDAKTDFAVLCANCHRMIHKLKDPSDLNYFKKLILR